MLLPASEVARCRGGAARWFAPRWSRPSTRCKVRVASRHTTVCFAQCVDPCTALALLQARLGCSVHMADLDQLSTHRSCRRASRCALLDALARCSFLPSQLPLAHKQSQTNTHTRTQELSSRQSVRLTEALAGSPRVLLSKLRELASLGLGAGGAADPLAQVRAGAPACSAAHFLACVPCVCRELLLGSRVPLPA